MKNIWKLHQLNTTPKLDVNATQMTVKGVEFLPLEIKVAPPYKKEMVVTQKGEIHQFYQGQEMLDLAMMAAFYANIPSFEATVQRKGKDIFIHSVKNINSSNHAVNIGKPPLLGGDLEVMLRKHNYGAFVALPYRKDHEDHIGTDRALLRKNTSFFQPIVELRADPQPTGLRLHKEFLRLKMLLNKKATRHHLAVVSSENPTGRFVLGGHLHISNERPTYRKVSLLDALVTVPLTSRWRSGSLLRRKTFGRLGSVRVNDFDGFEYRSLPSWYAFIDHGEALFQWIETVFFNDYLPKIPISLQGLYAYYNGDDIALKKEVERIFSNVDPLLRGTDKKMLENWIAWLSYI